MLTLVGGGVEKLKEDPKKYKNQVTHPLRSASISIFSL